MTDEELMAQAQNWLNFNPNSLNLLYLLKIVNLKARLNEHDHFFSVMHADRIAELRAALEKL